MNARKAPLRCKKPLRRTGFRQKPYDELISLRVASQERRRENGAHGLGGGNLASGGLARRRSTLRQRFSKPHRTQDGDSAKDIKAENDQLVREILALRDKKCFTCPQTAGLQVGHLIKRGVEIVRWDLENCNAQCPPCNRRHNEKPHFYENKFILRFGGVALGKLIVRAGYRGKLTYTELSEIRDRLRLTLEQLTGASL